MPILQYLGHFFSDQAEFFSSVSQSVIGWSVIGRSDILTFRTNRERAAAEAQNIVTVRLGCANIPDVMYAACLQNSSHL